MVIFVLNQKKTCNSLKNSLNGVEMLIIKDYLMNIKPVLLFTIIILFSLFSCSKQEKTITTLKVPTCLESQSLCQINTQVGKLSILFDHSTIRPEAEFTIFIGNNALTQNFTVTGFMEGKSMYMGKIPLFFSTKINNGYKEAKTMLGSCSEKEMIWLLQLTITPVSNATNIEPEHFSIEFTSMRN